jgi:hypothetical protein
VTSRRAPDPPSPQSAPAETRVGASALAPILVITVLGLVVRAVPVLAAPFPLNDGGLFVRMAETLAGSGFSFPPTVEFNGNAIPFAYPPLGLYLTAALHQVLGLDLIDLAHFLPLIFASLTVPVAALICLELMNSRVAALAAAGAYALVPRAWDWLVDGGGLTRAPGVLLALLAILAATKALGTDSRRSFLISGALLGLCGLTHPQAAIFGTVSVVFLIVWRRSLALPRIGLTVVAAVVAVAPWVLAVVAAHGLAPFLAALRTGGSPLTALYYLVSLRFTGAPLADVFVVMFGMGVLTAGVRRDFLLPSWAVLLFFTDARAVGQYAMLPVSMLVGYATAQLLALRPPTAPHSNGIASMDSGALVVAGLLILGLVGSLAAPLRDGTPLVPLSVGDRVAMHWISTQPAARYAVISGENWGWDETSEWFPQQTGRISVATVQGLEWTSADWDKTVSRYRELQACSSQSITCLFAWMTDFGAPDYVYVSGRREAELAGAGACCATIVIAMQHDSHFAEVYSKQGVNIFRVKAGTIALGTTRLVSIPAFAANAARSM